MKKILIIAGKELLSTFRQRNLLLIMFLSPIVLSTILGLAFGGLGGGGMPDFVDIRVAVVNLDRGFNLQQQLSTTAISSSLPNLSLLDLEFEIEGQTINLGEQLQQNSNLALQEEDFDPSTVSLNLGNQLAAILLSQPLTATSVISGDNAGDNEVFGTGGGFDLSEISCPLLSAEEETGTIFAGSLDEWLDAEAVGDPVAAREGVTRGDYAAAVIIPPDFSNQLVPLIGISHTNSFTPAGTVEVFANNGTPISAGIVRSVVEGIVNEFVRVNVALNALVLTMMDTAGIDTAGIDTAGIDTAGSNTVNGAESGALALNGLDVDLLTSILQLVDASVLEPLGCLIVPGASNVQLRQQPLDEVQTRSGFSVLMVVLGGSQVIFFALFTGVFGINSIYEDRIQGTLQRLLVTPTPSSSILAGRLLGNLVIVISQLLILLLALATITMLVEQNLTFIWGNNLLALLMVVLGIALFTTGLGALIVGLARSSEQVQLIGPLITILLGALSGSFGFMLPPQVAQLSPIWWGIDAMRKLASNESDIGLHLVMLFTIGILFASVGTYFFRRRMDL